LELNGTHELLVYADVNVMDEDMNIINTGRLGAGRTIDLEVNTEKRKYMFMSHHQNIEENHNLLTANELFANVTKFNYWGTTAAANQNCTMTKLKADRIQGMLFIILFRVF